jgi:p-aminobenzoyl-glutamate transporter AbgT
MKSIILDILIWIVVAIGSFIMGYESHNTKVPTTYSSSQIDDLIKHDELLTSIIAEQFQYEKDVVSEKGSQ